MLQYIVFFSSFLASLEGLIIESSLLRIKCKLYIAKKTTPDQLLDCQTLKQPPPQLTPPFAGPMSYVL